MKISLYQIVMSLTLQLCLILFLQVAAQSEEIYDLVLQGGRVMDPETNFDGLANVGISNGQIATITSETLQGKQILDVTGLVVAPGFIDLHAHGQDQFSSGLQALDGVTTALEMEIGVSPIAPWLLSKEGKSTINYGATAGHIAARIAAIHGVEVGHTLSMEARKRIFTKASSGEWMHENATEEQLATIQKILKDDVENGALGIGMGIQYTPGADRKEVLRVFKLAKMLDVVCFVHTRHIGRVEPESSVAGIQEVIADAAITGTSLHIAHINSSSLSDIKIILDMIVNAEKNGLDITTEMYPYTAGSTSISSALFDDGWKNKLGISYGDLEWPATGERLDSDSFAKYRKSGGPVIIHMMKPEDVTYALTHPVTIIASDGMPFINGRAHPRGAGTFSRVLGYYCRELKAITLMEALRKMTIMPANRIEGTVSAMKKKGRVQVGADADITVFDPKTVRDKATFDEPANPSVGIHHVLVGGIPVVLHGVLKDGVHPGMPIRR